MNQHYEAFRKKLQEIFMMDHAELDFGIYRIMNHKRNQINDFLDKQLLPQVEQTLKEYVKTDDSLQQELTKAIEGCKNLGIDPDTNPKVQQLRQQIAQSSTGVDDLQNTVFSRLTQFFSRYYEGGDFVSQRRYKSGGNSAYAIPYNGEEVKLYWANYDQFFVKTSEYFKNYAFKLRDGRKVCFVLIDASTEQNDNKNTNGMERRFDILRNDGNQPVVEEVEEELHISFTYELMQKPPKQEVFNKKAFEALSTVLPAGWQELLTKEQVTDESVLLEKHISAYTAKNSFDYFIHKDLGSFLSRELDFYIKNEVFVIADLDTAKLQGQLAVVKAIEKVGQKIIDFLAQLENFQKRLWLKKKFVVQSDYCITLDRVPEKFYPEICANDEQRKEWVRLFAIDEIKGDGLFTKGYSEPLTIEFLQQNQSLVLDTKLYSSSFKHKLIAELEDLDDMTNGLLVNSENYQALQLLFFKYLKDIKCIYIDPPYNIQGDGFPYKDNYKISSWTSLMDDRIEKGVSLLGKDSLMLCSIGEDREGELRMLFNDQRFEMVIPYIWKSRAKPTNTGEAKLRPQIVGEFVYMGLLNAKQRFKAITSGIERKYNKTDEYGKYRTTTILTSNLGRYRRETLRFSIAGYTPPTDKRWKSGQEEIQELYENHRIGFNQDGEPFRKHYEGDEDEQNIPFWTYIPEEISGTAETGKTELSNYIPEHGFDTVKPKELIMFFLDAITSPSDIILDYFAGSGTTGDAVIDINNEDGGNRKYILVDTANYFNSLLKKRITRRCYSGDWNNGKPVSRKGISQCFKYIRLEQYEDTLNNLEVNDGFGKPDNESYVLRYMLDTETRDSLINTKDFIRPFDYTIKTTRDNELVDTPVDLVDTFNYLIGLHVDSIHWHKDDNICVVEGTTHIEKEHALVIWRNQDVIKNDDLNDFFRKQDYSTLDREFDVIYVNGDNTLPNLKSDEEHWKVRLIEQEMMKRMFEEE